MSKGQVGGNEATPGNRHPAAALDSVAEVKATSAVLLAAAFVIDAQCRPVNDMFMACKKLQPDSHPIACLENGIAVSSCVNATFDRIRETCQKTFEKYWKCLDMNNQMFMYCRDEEIAFHKCTFEKMGVKKSLWKARSPEDGFKADDDLPAHKNWPYRLHVWRYKRT